MFRKLMLSLSLSLLSLVTYKPAIVPTFSYQYQVIANSYDPMDLVFQYRLRDHLVEVFEREIMSLPIDDQSMGLVTNLSQFEMEDSVKTKLINGVLIATVGLGTGPTLEGTFPHMYCQDSTPEYRLFILDWLLGNS